MELDKSRGKANRGIENPLSAIFDLADDVSRYAKYVQKMVWYAIIFMGFWVFFSFLLVIATLTQGQVVPFALVLGMLISTIIVFYLIIRTHWFFQYYVNRYNGIVTVRDAEDLVKIPQGATLVDRYLSFLRTSHPPLEALMKRNPKALQRNVKVKGASGRFYEFALHLTLPASGLSMLGMGQPGYGLYVQKYKGRPKMAAVLDLKNAMDDIAKDTGIVPTRVVMLYKYPPNFKGLSEEIYSYLVREEFKIELKGKTENPVLQIVGETEEGYYDFTPLVPEFADRLP